jgi:hypothetical protein
MVHGDAVRGTHCLLQYSDPHRPQNTADSYADWRKASPAQHGGIQAPSRNCRKPSSPRSHQPRNCSRGNKLNLVCAGHQALIGWTCSTGWWTKDAPQPGCCGDDAFWTCFL